ncbi:hypothetical protein IKQ19_12035 [Candidatus Saccharibacteria bacterium]|nr:hypothetical protein [Candidatus Saccharibacteria bacterium]
MAKYFFKIKENEDAGDDFKIKVKENVCSVGKKNVNNIDYTFDFDESYRQGLLEVDKKKKEIEDRLKAYPFPENANEVDLSKVMNDWFPVKKWDIFLSHSHNDDDEKKSIAISCYLREKFQLECFVDSCTWGYADTLIEKMKKYCIVKEQIDKGFYNAIVTHVHIMLNSALMKTMQSATAFLFLQTNNSLEKKHMTADDWTYSSWIYSELCMSRVMSDILYSPKNELNDKSNILLESAQLPMGYSDVTTSHLKNITLRDLQYCFHPLYQQNPVPRNEEAFESLYNKSKTDDKCIYDVGLDSSRLKCLKY